MLIKKQSNTFAGNYFWNIMFAVVKIAGQQFKVQKDQEIFVQQLAGNVGDKVEFSEVLLTDTDGKIAVGTDVKSVIKAEILGHVQGDKVIAFKMKRRKGFRKKVGHRTHFTKLKISEIA
ncbi:50S ribosomal protein L21 [Chitinophaga sp. XS-30]|uniref:50S ribosomal protein L21 n=1 Tax=Chitinophaga sp. XS-30 TaxID=2604421 RepID=UPI001FEDDE16|nr:50S ribosomal protein L21 [Chitinophaga sp. XS-30]